MGAGVAVALTVAAAVAALISVAAAVAAVAPILVVAVEAPILVAAAAFISVAAVRASAAAALILRVMRDRISPAAGSVAAVRTSLRMLAIPADRRSTPRPTATALARGSVMVPHRILSRGFRRRALGPYQSRDLRWAKDVRGQSPLRGRRRVPSVPGRGWHRHHHLGWIGPLFWPYAYGDFFYYALWPYDYADFDPFWYYGYGDIYEGIFSPYLYDEYVQGPGAPARMAALTQSVAQSCSDEAAEVTGWPIDQISDAVQPNQQQVAYLDDLGNAIVKASDVIKSHCPTTVSFTPTGRLDACSSGCRAWFKRSTS